MQKLNLKYIIYNLVLLIVVILDEFAENVYIIIQNYSCLISNFVSVNTLLKISHV